MEHKHLEVFGKPVNSNSGREKAEHIMSFSQYLSPSDRALVELIYDNGVTASKMAVALGVNPSGLYQRLGRLKKRLNGDECKRLIAVAKMIPPDAREVCIDHFVGMKSVGSIIKNTGHERKWVTEVVKTYGQYLRGEETA